MDKILDTILKLHYIPPPEVAPAPPGLEETPRDLARRLLAIADRAQSAILLGVGGGPLPLQQCLPHFFLSTCIGLSTFGIGSSAPSPARPGRDVPPAPPGLRSRGIGGGPLPLQQRLSISFLDRQTFPPLCKLVELVLTPHPSGHGRRSPLHQHLRRHRGSPRRQRHGRHGHPPR